MDIGVRKSIRTLAKANILLYLSILASCSSPLTPEEIEWKRAIDRENWVMCELAYSNSDVPTYHYQHQHNRRVRDYDIKSDLTNNRCKSILRDYWINY